MPIIPTKTVYLEMFNRPAGDVAAPRCDLEIERLWRPTNAAYLELYRSVGSNWNWVDRLVMSNENLEAILGDDRVEVFVLHVAEQAAGFAELDRRQDGEIELAYFGLSPPFVGQGLGKYFLNWTLHTAWSHGPRRVWVHTCDLDHPAALPTYLKAGFCVYDEKTVDQLVPDEPDRKQSD